MRRLIALPKHFVRNAWRRLFGFAGAFGVPTRPRVAFASLTCDLFVTLYLKSLNRK